MNHPDGHPDLELNERYVKLLIEWENYSLSSIEIAEDGVHGDRICWVPKTS